MKTLAIILNIATAIFLLVAVATNVGTDSSFLILLLWLVLPAVNIAALRVLPSASDPSWPVLWLRRKTLEEKKRIEELQSRN